MPSPRTLTRSVSTFLGFLAALALLGCSGKGSPTSPTNQTTPPAGELVGAPEIASLSDSTVTGQMPIGALEVTLDLETMTGDIAPRRIAQAVPTGTKFVVNLMDLFTQDPCDDCLKIDSLAFNLAGNIEVGLTMRHPFQAPDMTGGVGTAALHVNNLRGFVIVDTLGPDGFPSGDDPDSWDPVGLNLAEPVGFGDNVQNVVADFLVNPDGYSRDVTPIVAPGFDTIYPYVVFGADDGTVGFGNFGSSGWLGSELEAPTGFNVFAQGSTASSTLELAIDQTKLGVSQIKFTFILTCSYVVSRKTFSGLGDIQDPKYFMPEGAQMSAWRVQVVNEGTDGLGTPPRGLSSEQVTLQIGVRDWQKAFDASYIVPSLIETTSPNGILGRSYPKTVGIDIPGILAAPLKITVDTSTALGTEADPVETGPIVVTNNPAAAPGRYVGFVKVVDERTNSRTVGAPPEGHALYETGGIDADLTPYNLTSVDAPYATYQTFEYVVGNRPLVASIDYATASIGGRLVVDMRGSSAELPAFLVQRDLVFDYGGNPTEFDTPDVTSLNDLFVGAHTYLLPGQHTLGLRVTDNLLRTDIDTYNIIVLPTRQPFIAPSPVQTLVTGITQSRFGAGMADFQDVAHANPLGGETLLRLGSNLYYLFWGRPGALPRGLYLLRSTNEGTNWSPTPIFIEDAATIPEYAGATIAGAHDTATGQDHLYIALGARNYVLAVGQPANVHIYENTASGSGAWTEYIITNTTSATRHAAIAPALAVNPADPDQVHLLYGYNTAAPTVSGIVNGAVEWRSSATGAVGLVADAPFIQGGAVAPAWMGGLGGDVWSLDLGIQPISGRLSAMLSHNRAIFVVHSTDSGATWNTGAVETMNLSPNTFYRDGDLVIDPWDTTAVYVMQQRRGSSTGNQPSLNLYRAQGGAVSPIGTARAASDFVGVPNSLSANIDFLMHPTGEIEAYWTEADPGVGFDQGPHIEHDVAPWAVGVRAFANSTDLLLDPPITNRGVDPAAVLATDGTVHAVWVNEVSGTIYYRRG